MSIEAMKRIKSLLQDGDKIDSHTISAVVAECDAVILTQQPDNTACKSVQKRLEVQQPATPEPVYQIRKAFTQDTEWAWRDATEALFHMHPKEHRRILYTHPAPGVPDDVARDAIATVREQYRGTDWGKAAEGICDAIDAAMLAASSAQKG